MGELVLDKFTNSGSQYEFVRDPRGNFLIRKDGKVTYKGFSLKQSQKQYNSFKRAILKGGENG